MPSAKVRHQRREAKRRRRQRRISRESYRDFVGRKVKVAAAAHEGQCNRWPWLAGQLLDQEDAAARDRLRRVERERRLVQLGRIEAS